MTTIVAKVVRAVAKLGANTVSLLASYQPKTPAALMDEE